MLTTQSYLDAVSAHLMDLPEDERRELLDDLEQHIAEVEAEGEGTLEEILGAPEAYARELRASSGLPAPDERLVASIAHRVVSSSPVRAMRRSIETEPLRSLRSFLPQLRPAWWVGRGYLGVFVVGLYLWRELEWGLVLPVPRIGGSTLVGLAAVLAGMWVSVAIGRRAEHDRGARVVNIAGNAATVIVLLLLAVNPLYGFGSYVPGAAAAEYVEVPVHSEYLTHPDGATISNICAYDSSLQPIDRVLLYDQDGRPISNIGPTEYGDETIPGVERDRGLGNAYPRRQQVFDQRSGELIPFECPSVGTGADPQSPADPGPLAEPEVPATSEE